MYASIRRAAAASVLLVLFLSFTGCSMSSYRAFLMNERTDHTSWSVEFRALDGDLAHHFTRSGGSPSTVKVVSSVGSGSMKLQIQLGDRIQDVAVGSTEVNLKDWDDGDIILRIAAQGAKDGSVHWEWGQDSAGTSV